MIYSKVTVEQSGIRQFADDLPDIRNLIMNAIAEEFRDHVRSSYMSGQMLQRITSETYDSTKFFKVKDGAYGVRPGMGIDGRLNYLYGLARRGYPFMSLAASSFAASGRPGAIAERVMNGIIRRGGYRT